MKMHLVFFDKTTDVTSKLQKAFQGQPSLSARQLPPGQIAAYKGMDALYLPLIAAERWKPRPVFNQSQVLKTDKDENGWPPFIVAGIALRRDDVRSSDHVAELKLTIQAVVEAVNLYNNQNGSALETIGFWTENLAIHRMDPSEAGRIIRSVFENQIGSGN